MLKACPPFGPLAVDKASPWPPYKSAPRSPIKYPCNPGNKLALKEISVRTAAKPSGNNAALARGAYLLAVLIASYAAIWTLTGFIGIALLRLGLERSEAVIFGSLLGFVLYPALVIAALAARRPLQFWGLLMAVSVLLEVLSRYWGIS